MSFHAEWETRSGIAIGRLHGELTGTAVAEWRREFAAETRARSRNVLLEFRDLEILSSEALGALLSAAKEVRLNGGDLKLLNLPPFISEIFIVTRLLRVFEIFNDETVALRSFISVRAQQAGIE